MKSHSLIAALLICAGVATADAAMVTTDHGSFTLSYEDSTVFGDPFSPNNGGGGVVGFGWTVPSVVNVVSLGAPVEANFALPAFTISVNPGWILGGPVSVFLGNLSFTEVGGTTSVTASGKLALNGGPALPASGALAQVTTASGPGFAIGYYAGEASSGPLSFSSVAFSDGNLRLTAGGGAFDSISAQPQNEMRFSFVATPVPEPEIAVLMLAGLLTVGAIARRRRAT